MSIADFIPELWTQAHVDFWATTRIFQDPEENPDS